MRRFDARLEGITLSPSGQPVAMISCREEHIPQPGQAVLVCKPNDWQPLRKTLFPIHTYSDGFVADASPEPSWRIGDALDVFGPIGMGFTPPPDADKWLLVSFESPPDRIFALIQPGLELGAAIALSADRLPAHLPPQVEWVPDVTEALPWANYLALDLPLEMLPSLRSWLGLSSVDRFPFLAQALIIQSLPCGLGACYACAIKSKHGSVLACTEGPIFELNQLEF